MHFCYLDEAGCTGALKSSTDSVQPVFILAGLFVGAYEVSEVTTRFLALKHRFFPPADPTDHRLAHMLHELKGADLRRQVRDGRRRGRRAVAFLHEVLQILEDTRARFVARVYVKEIGRPIDSTAIYTAATQSLLASYQDFLTSQNSQGTVICDCRSKAANVQVAHSIFTQKFSSTGDNYNRVIELPLFANSDNHAGIQICDLLCSALLFPIATYSYCLGHVSNVHVDARYLTIKRRYGQKLLPLQHRYTNLDGRMTGGVTVSDGLLKRPSSVMFR